jgi:hypothetical protein
LSGEGEAEPPRPPHRGNARSTGGRELSARSPPPAAFSPGAERLDGSHFGLDKKSRVWLNSKSVDNDENAVNKIDRADPLTYSLNPTHFGLTVGVHRSLQKSKFGKKLWNLAKKSKIRVTIEPASRSSGPTASFEDHILYLDPNDSLFIGPNAPVRRYPEEIPPYDPINKQSILNACACVLGHEWGHAFLGMEDEPNGHVVRNCDNLIRCDFGMPNRLKKEGADVLQQ